MQFFLFDFALALVALLGYRTLVVATRQGAAAAHPRPQPVLPRRQEEPRRASLHRLINFW